MILNIRRAVKYFAWKHLSAAKALREFVSDARRYQALSTPSSRETLSRLDGLQLECQVTKDYHRIEKGLALANPKRPFGADAKERLQFALKDRDLNYAAMPYAAYAKDALAALEQWNNGGDIVDLVSPPVPSWVPSFSEEELSSFFRSRHSVRAFDKSGKIETATIQRAVSLALSSPSVCNRQAWRAHYFEGPQDVSRILKHQSGNRGFGNDASGVFIITADVRLFSGSGERNQRWVDGGIFAMSLVWALHGLGVATCMLNWSKGNNASRLLREEADLDINEDVIVLIAVGRPLDGYRAARSARRSVSDVLISHASSPVSKTETS